MSKMVFYVFSLAVLGGFAVPQQTMAQSVQMDWRDASYALGSGFASILTGTGSNLPRAAYAKVIVNNSSTGTRDVECRLDLENTSLDIATVRLPAGGFSTLSLQVAGDPSGIEWVLLKCRVTSASTSGVTATWAKMTAMWVSSVTTDQD